MSFDTREYDIKHWQNIKAYMRRTQSAYYKSIDRIVRIYEQLPSDVPFDIDKFPDIKKAIDKELRNLAKQIDSSVINGINNEWMLSGSKNDDMVDALAKGRTLPKELEEKWKGRNLEALAGFKKRTTKGMGLSDRVWQTVKIQAVNIERHMALGIYEGTPAKSLATEMKQYLKEPDRLFRRVRDAEGELRLSKAAKAYKPGRGVYRSSYQNALRLTRTETNLAYQKADAERWKQQDFVTGVIVKRSNVPYDCDICEAGTGVYPVSYEWSLWHPNCRCVAFPKLPTDEEFMAGLEAKKQGKDFNYSGRVTKMPSKWVKFQKENNYQHLGH
jgi:hypothetical protein